MTGSCSRSLGPILVFSLLAIDCGSGRQLESIALEPSAVTAQHGQAQFTATGTFNKKPSPITLTSKDVTWCVGELATAPNASPNSCVGNVNPFATVDQNGLATCNSTVHGTGYILAGTLPGHPSMIADGGFRFKVSGYATLTCP